MVGSVYDRNLSDLSIKDVTPVAPLGVSADYIQKKMERTEKIFGGMFR